MRDKERSRKMLGQLIKDARTQRGMTQKAVAERIGMKQSTLSAIEKGQRGVSVESLQKISAFYRQNFLEELQKLESGTTEQLPARSNITVSSPLSTTAEELFSGLKSSKSTGKSHSIYLSSESSNVLETLAAQYKCSKSKVIDELLCKISNSNRI